MLAIILLTSFVSAALADNLAVLSNTLKTYQKAACEEEWMTLKCPIGTAILVNMAKYGKASIDGDGKCSTIYPAITDNQVNSTCVWPATTQHSLLQTVVEVCQKKRQCKFNTNPKTITMDYCTDMPKYIEVVYKCRPYEFRSKVACENDAINLSCYPNQRVVIYSAFFGRTEYESLQCPQPNGVKEQTCMVNDATEKVVDICHGKRHCSIAANSTTFGNPCRPESKPYLKVVYTCVPRSVLRDQNGITDLEPDELSLLSDSEEGFDRADFRAEFSPSPNVESPRFQHRNNDSNAKSPTESLSPPRTRTNVEENQEKFYLYIIVSVSAGLLLFLILVISKLLVSRHKAKRDTKFQSNNETLPNGFTDDISEIDADIDLTTPVPVPMQDTRIPETQLAERLHGERYYGLESRLPLSSSATLYHHHHLNNPPSSRPQLHIPGVGVRVDLGNHMVGTDNLQTILRPENSRRIAGKSYYYG